MKNKLVVFDLDGTLIDSLNASARCIQKSLSLLRKRDFTLEQIQAHFGQPEELVFSALCGVSRINSRDADVDELMRDYLEQIKLGIEKFPLYAGAAELIRELDRDKVPMAICTARGDQATAVILKAHKLFDCFKMIVTGNDVKVQKPSGEGLRNLIHFFRVEPKDTFFIGDSPADWQAAHEVGAVGVRAFWGSHPGSAQFSQFTAFDDLAQLETFFRTLAK